MLISLLLLLAVQQTNEGVLFQCQTNGARVVYLAGDFNEWAHNQGGRIIDPAFAMTESNGVWRKVVKLDAGTYRFKFNFNGEPNGWFVPESIAERDAHGNAVFRVRPNGEVEVCGEILPRQTSRGVLFQLCAPQAHIVYLAGDFNHSAKNRDGLVFDPRFAMNVSGQVWSATIRLPRGKHEYQFVIDGDLWLPRASIEVK